MIYAIGSIILVFAFVLHLLILLLKKYDKDATYNQNIAFNGGMSVGDSQQINPNKLLYEVDDYSDTVIAIDSIQGSKATVTGPFNKLMVRLHNMSDNSVYDYQLDHQIIIGREGTGLPDVTVKFNDSKMSARHCKIYRQGNQIYIQDLGSTNHTYVNNCLLEGSVPCNTGDIIQMGYTVVKLFLFY